MFRKRSFALDIAKPDALCRLESQLRSVPLRGWIRNDEFHVQKFIVPRVIQTNTYPIHGRFEETEDGVRVSYSIRPSILSLIISAILLITLLHSLYTLVYSNGIIFFPVLLCLWNVLFNGFILWEQSVCIRSFEAFMSFGDAENS